MNVEISENSYIGGYIGGIGGYMPNVNNCHNKGNITVNCESASSVYAGGISGFGDNRTVNRSYSTGNITAIGNAWMSLGGISGYGGIANYCYNTGNITGLVSGRNLYTAGITACSGTANFCYNTGNIICSVDDGNGHAGGILGGDFNSANNCYNAGNIKHSANYTRSYNPSGYSDYVGGIGGVGNAINHCYNIGDVSSNVYSECTGKYQGKFGAIVGWTNSDYTGVNNSYYSENIKLKHSFIGDNETNNSNLNESGTKKSDEYMKSQEFFGEFMKGGATNWYFRGYTYPKLAAMPMEVKRDVELTVENTFKKYDITTHVNGSEGGTISGQQDFVYETVRYGESNKKQIVMQPSEGYGIAKITVNEKEIEFNANEDGSYILSAGYFYEMNEDKQIIVTFAPKNKLLTIKKVDTDDPNIALEGAKFKIEQVEGRQEVSDEVGELTGNSKEYAMPITTKDMSSLIGEITNNIDDEYNFVKNSNGTYTSNNVGKHLTTAHSYFRIDLSNKEGAYAIKLNAKISSEISQGVGDYGYATITKDTNIPDGDSGNFMKIGWRESDAKDYISEPIIGGDIYYLHVMYIKDDRDNTATRFDDKVTINSIKLYEATINKYNFENIDRKYVSSNSGHNGTASNSYIPIDLTNTVGQYNLKINAQVSSTGSSNYGYVKITESEEIPTDTNDRLIWISGEKEAKDYTTILQAGKKYYVHLGYDKTTSTSTASGSCTDNFTINSIELSLNTEDFITTEVTTNSEGIVVASLHPGTFKITEIEAPKGYKINNELENQLYTFEYGKDNVIEVKDQKADGMVTVHYYEKGTGPEHNCEAKIVSEDAELRGNLGEEYKSQVILEKDGYTLMKDEDGEYVVPDNASGSFEESKIDVYYYYEVPNYSYSIHYFYDGIENEELRANIPVDLEELEDGTIKRADIEEKIQQNKIDGYYLYDVRNLPLTITEDENNNVIEVYYEKIGTPAGTYKLNVTKVNENNPDVKVEGAEFEVYEIDGETEKKVGTLTHKGNGLYESEEIKITKEGTINVKLKETKVPDGYKAVQDITGTITVELQEGEEEFKYVVTESSLGEVTNSEDKKYGINFTIEEPEKDPLTGKYNLVVTKVNSENPEEKVPGAEFEIYEEGTKVGTLTDSNNDGIYESGDVVISEVGTKNITIKETKVPTGFAKIADKTGTITFEKSAEKEEYIVKESSFGTVENGNIAFTIEEPILKGTYNLEITKVDTEGNKVPGAEFTVYEGTTEIAKLTDNNNDGIYESGSIGISNSGTISITIEETTVPEGYLKADNITGTITFEKSVDKEEYIVKESTLGNVSEEGFKVSFEVIEEKQKEEENQKYDLAVKKFVSAIDGKKTTSREPKVEVSEDGKITYSQSDKIEQVANNQEVTYTIRTYNESNIKGKGKRAIEYIPDGLVFLPKNQKNIDNGWVMYIVNEDGTWTKTDDPEKAKIVVTDNLVNKEIPAVDGKKVNHEDVEAIFKVDETKLTSKDRIIENIVEINTNDNSKPGENPDDKPGDNDDPNNDPDKNPTNNRTSEKLYVKYFDLSMKKYIKQVVVTDDKKSETIEVAKENQKDVKIEVNRSKANKTTLTVTYVLEVKNVGEIEGNADKITEYIPDEFKLEDSKAIWKIDGNIATTDSLKEFVIKPGETKEIEVVCIWNLSENTSGVRSNEAKIEEYSNPYDAKDPTDDNKDSSDIEVIIINDKYDLAIKKFISAIDNKEITTRAPKVELSQDGKITYTQNNEMEQVANNQEVTYTLRMYNESDIKGKGKRVIEYIPDGLVFLPENQTNKKYNWVMFKADENGKLTKAENAEEATIVVTDYLVNKEINAFYKGTDTGLSYLDVQAVFKVDETKLTSEDRIIENKVQIMPNENDDNPENDESTEKLYVKYFDLDITKYIKEVKVKNNKGETTRPVGEDQKGNLVKIDVKESDVKDTKITVTYGLIVRNIGEISGYATQVIDYIPQDFKLVEDGIWSIDGNKAITTSLENVLLNPGESTTIDITFEWDLTKENIGSRINEAKIGSYKNEYNAKDPTEDNNDKEEMLVTLKTGSEIIAYINIAVAFIAIITVGTYFVKRRVILK